MKDNISILDKYVKLNYSMIKNHLTGSCALAVMGGAIMFADMVIGLLLNLFMAIILVCISYSAVKRLFYTTMYAKGASIYAMLPVEYGEAVMTKVMMATAVVCLPNMLLSAMMLGESVAMIDGPGVWTEWFPLVTGGGADASQWYVPVAFMLSVVFESFCWAAVIFLAVTVYNTVPVKGRSGLTRVGPFLCCWLVFFLMNKIQTLGMLIDLDVIVIHVIFSAICLIVGAAACKGSEALLSKKYFLS